MDLLTLQSREKDFKNTAFDRAASEALAKLLAQENITVRFDETVDTAGFDILNRVLLVPVWTGISKYLNDMLLEHEVAHALFTPPAEWVEGIDRIAKKAYGTKNVPDETKMVIKDYINIVEDVRIDRLQRIRFPGARKDYAYGFKEIIVIRDLFGLASIPLKDRTFIDRANIYFKGGRENLNIPFTPAEHAKLLKLDATKTFDEVLDLAEELFMNDLQELRNSNIANSSGNKKSEKDSDESDQKSNNSGKGNSSEKEENNKEQGDEKGAGRGDEKDDDKNNSSGGDSSDEAGDNEAGDNEADDKTSGDNVEANSDVPSSVTNIDNLGNKENSKEKTQNKAEGVDILSGSDDNSKESKVPTYSKEKGRTLPAGIFQGQSTGNGVIPERPASAKALAVALQGFANNNGTSSGKTIVYGTIPSFNYKNIVDDFSTVMKQWRGSQNFKRMVNLFDDWKKGDKDSLSYLVKEFEMRKAAEMLKRESINKTGVLDVNRLYRYKFTDDVFRRHSSFPQGKNHGFVMIVDWSSSMSDNIDKTVRQMLSIAMFCKRMNMPFEVYIFRDPIGSCDNNGIGVTYFNSNEGDIEVGNVKLRNVLSSRMNKKDFKDAANVLLNYTGNYSIGSIDPMTGTPLNSALIVVPELLKKFKEETKVEILNVVVLTDGDSNSVYSVKGQKDFRRSDLGMKRNVLQNKKTHRDYPMTGFNTREMTVSLLKNIKDIIECNLIGFYITAATVDGVINYTVPKYVKRVTGGLKKAYKKFAEKNGFIPVTSAGYDEYYFVFMNNINTSQNFSVSTESVLSDSSGGLVSSMKLKNMRRVLLRRFVEMIASGSGFGKKKEFDIREKI